jgi:hypothetical protein
MRTRLFARRLVADLGLRSTINSLAGTLTVERCNKRLHSSITTVVTATFVNHNSGSHRALCKSPSMLMRQPGEAYLPNQVIDNLPIRRKIPPIRRRIPSKDMHQFMVSRPFTFTPAMAHSPTPNFATPLLTRADATQSLFVA